MKILLNLLVFLTVVSIVASCSKKTETSSTVTSLDEWPELDSFHTIIADAYHPYKDSANLMPARKLAEAMAGEAEKWQASTLPEKVNTADVKVQLEKLKTSARAMADQIKAGAKDEDIGASLTALHDNFHSIMEAWYKSGEKQHEH